MYPVYTWTFQDPRVCVRYRAQVQTLVVSSQSVPEPFDSSQCLVSQRKAGPSVPGCLMLRVISRMWSQLASLSWLTEVPSSCRVDGSCMFSLIQAVISAHRDFEVSIRSRPGSNPLTVSQELQTATALSLLPISSDGNGQETDPNPKLFLFFWRNNADILPIGLLGVACKVFSSPKSTCPAYSWESQLARRWHWSLHSPHDPILIPSEELWPSVDLFSPYCSNFTLGPLWDPFHVVSQRNIVGVQLDTLVSTLWLCNRFGHRTLASWCHNHAGMVMEV